MVLPRRTRVSVLGVGVMGRLHARVFAQLAEDFELAGVYDPVAQLAGEVAATWSTQAFLDERDAVTAADLVVIASPIDCHAGAARRALVQGRHVLVEKPVCATAAQASSLVRAVQHGQHLFVGHSERWNPAVRALRRLVPAADIRSIRIRRTATSVRPAREHGVLVSLGVHDLDLVAYLTSSLVSVHEVLLLEQERADLVLSIASGAIACLYVDAHAHRRERTLEVITKDAVYVADLLGPSLSVRSKGDGPTTACPVRLEEPLVAQAAAIARVLSGGDEPVATGIDGARALSLVEQATSLRRHPELVTEAS